MSTAAIEGWRYCWLAWVELPVEILGTGLALYHQNNLFIMPLYTVGELVLLALTYGTAVRSAGLHRVLPWLVSAFSGYTVLDCLLAPDLTWFKPGQQVLQSLLILGLVVMYFRQLLQEARMVRLVREPLFWMSLGASPVFCGLPPDCLVQQLHAAALFNGIQQKRVDGAHGLFRVFTRLLLCGTGATAAAHAGCGTDAGQRAVG